MIHENIQEIQNIIRPYTSKWKSHKDEKALGADLNWNASRFFSKIIFKAKASDYDWPNNKLVAFTNDYNSKNNATIDANSLIDKHWIRNVLGLIILPDAVRKITYEFEQKQRYKQELAFIREFYEFNNSKQEVSKKGYTKFLRQFKKTRKLSLDQTWIEKHWITAKKDDGENVKIGSIEYYYNLLDNWNDIEFLHALKNEKSKQGSKGLAIQKEDFNDIHMAHKSYFTATPSIDDLKQQEIIREIGPVYYINFYNAQISYWDTLNDKISALVWEMIVNDPAVPNDKERVKVFLNKILYWENSWAAFYKHTSKPSKKIFVNAAVELVLEEPDLIGVNEEFSKCCLDDNIGSRYAFLANRSISEDNLKPSTDYYEFYQKMHNLSEKFQGNLFYVQDVRGHLAFLIKTIIACDQEFTNTAIDGIITSGHFPLTKKLLKDGLEKPYLLWETCHFLVQNYPTKIPYLLVEPQFASLAFHLITKVRIEGPGEIINQLIRQRLYEKSIRLILDAILSKPSFQNSDVALVIFQLFKEINRDKFRSLSNVRTLNEQFKIRENHQNTETLLLTLIGNYPINGYNVHTANKAHLLPLIFPNLVELFKDYHESEWYFNGTIQFPIAKLDGLSWLSKSIRQTKYEGQFLDINSLRLNLATLFYDAYTEKIQQKMVVKKDLFTHDQIDAIPNWSERNERLALIEWIYPMLLLKETGKLTKFLTPLLTLKKAEHEYDEENRFNAKKIRSHLFVLLTALSRARSLNEDYFLMQNHLKDIRIEIEKQITVTLKEYAVAGRPSKIDILHSSFEQQLFCHSQDEELLPQIARAINWFDDRSEIINTLISTSDLLRLLIILDWITSEGVKKEIIEKIKQAKIIEFFNSQSWLPEIELTLSKLSQYKDLVQQTKDALDYWQKKIIPNRNDDEDKQVSFAINLMLAYNEKDINKINQLEAPKSNLINAREFKSYHHKQFFIGLINFEINPQAAYQIFDKLHNQFKENTSISINRFAAKINWAINAGDESVKIELLKEGLQEWKEAEGNLPKPGLEEIRDKAWTNKLTVFYHLRDFAEFEKLYLQLPAPYQMMEDVMSMKIELLIIQEKQHEAIYVLQNGKEYHKALDGTNPEFINELQSLVNDKSDIRLLRSTFLEIFSKKPKTLIQIFPEKLNGQIEIEKFITKEFAIALNKTLDKVLSIGDIRLEDKYNDLVQLALESRFNVFGWIVRDQARGGFSASGKNPGERDIIIQDSNGETITVCEAFIYRDFARTESHLKKIFNYHHDKNHFISLIYDLGTQSDFEQKWNTYIADTVCRIKYPVGFEIDDTKTKDVTDEFDYKNSAIKIGQTTHGENTNIYHLMVNLNYHV